MTTGVRLDFYTNSSFIRFCYPTKDTRAYASMKGDNYELLVNGIFVAQTNKSGTFEYNLPAGNNRVSLYFPIGAYGAIKDLDFDKYLHPNALGFEVYVQNLIKQIEKAVK